MSEDFPDISLSTTVADWLAAQQGKTCQVVALSGLPGTGKTTLSRRLVSRLEEKYGLRAVGFSMDDVYLPRAAREELARRVHPLLVTRGVPGTHEVSLALELIEQLTSTSRGERTKLPSFDKATDDRAPESSWPMFEGVADVLFVDNWFWDVEPQSESELHEPLNRREQDEDGNAVWRRWVNRALGNDYQMLFARADVHIRLEAPSLSASLRWRVDQERELFAARGRDPDEVDAESFRPFLQLMERTASLPLSRPADLLVRLGVDHAANEIAGL